MLLLFHICLQQVLKHNFVLSNTPIDTHTISLHYHPKRYWNLPPSLTSSSILFAVIDLVHIKVLCNGFNGILENVRQICLDSIFLVHCYATKDLTYVAVWNRLPGVHSGVLRVHVCYVASVVSDSLRHNGL